MVADVKSKLSPQAWRAHVADALREERAASASSDRGATVQALFFAHFSIYLALNILLFIINLLATPGFWWFLYPLWAWGMVLALHAGLTFPWRGLLGAHLAFGAVLSAGLMGIDAATPGGPWWFYPVGAVVLTLLFHAGLRLDARGERT
ncbi:MAG TPA: 2TM domain-containing protein [Thermomicrobiales bacterium]|nr:2TM domain-containing protein [Thermomicrobiales bacterium]